MLVEHFPSEGVGCRGVAASYNVPETWNLNKHCLDLIQKIEMYSMVGVLNTTITQFTNCPVK